jgi:hypothetical protein
MATSWRGIGVHVGGDFGHAFLRAGLVPITAWCSADAEPSYDLIAALDPDFIVRVSLVD